MVKDGGLGATGIFQRVGENGETVRIKGARRQDALIAQGCGALEPCVEVEVLVVEVDTRHPKVVGNPHLAPGPSELRDVVRLVLAKGEGKLALHA